MLVKPRSMVLGDRNNGGLVMPVKILNALQVVRAFTPNNVWFAAVNLKCNPNAKQCLVYRKRWGGKFSP